MSALANEIARLKRRLRYLEEQAASTDRLAATVETLCECDDLVDENGAHFVAWTQTLLKFRRNRDRVFDGMNLFAEPAWDILLELVLANAAGRRMAVNEASIASAVPATTALRHIKHLDDAGLILTSADPSDGRRRWLEMSPLGSHLMREALAR